MGASLLKLRVKLSIVTINKSKRWDQALHCLAPLSWEKRDVEADKPIHTGHQLISFSREAPKTDKMNLNIHVRT